MFRKLLLSAVVTGFVLSIAGQGAVTLGQDAKDKKAKGRLPPYYSDLVSDQQRQKIYDLQAKYAKQIDALNEQVNALERQRDTEIENVLTAEQKERLKSAREEAAAKKKKTAVADKKTAVDEEKAIETKPAAPPTTKKLKAK